MIDMKRYVGQYVDVIYQDGQGEITKRTVKVNGVANGRAQTFDVAKRAPRALRIDGILAALPAKRERVS